MAKTIKKAQKGFTLSEAKRKRDSLDYDARTSMQAARNRATRPGGSYDNIAKQLSERARKSDSLKNVFDKAIQKSSSKNIKKGQAGLVASNKRVGPIDPKGAWTKVQEQTLAGKRTPVSLKKDKELGATRMTAKKGIKVKAKGGNWIQSAIKKPGALRAQLGAKPGKPIPAGKLAKAAKAPGKLGQRARLAKTLGKMRKK